jgi:amino acid adenylation domain-containing protein
MNDSALATSSPAADRGGAPVLFGLCSDHQRPVELSYQAATASFSLADAPLAELDRLAVSAGATLQEVLLAAFQALAARHSGSDDIVLGSPNAARGSAQLDERVSYFADFLVIQVSLAGDPSFRKLVSRSRAAVLEALTRSTVPFDLAAGHPRPNQSLSYHPDNPAFQVVFAFQEEDRPVTLPGEAEVRRDFVTADTAKSDLSWSVYRGLDGLRLEVEYATDLFEPATVQALVGHWRALLRQAVDRPDLPVGQLCMLPAAERRSLASWSGSDLPTTGRRQPGGTVHELVSAAAAAHPNEVAVVSGADRLTYLELNARADALAGRLRALGVGPESCVGVLLEPSLETVIATLAVMKAGGVYVPLDAAFPAERMDLMLTEAGAGLVLAHAATAGIVPAGHWTVLDLDASPGDLGPAPERPPALAQPGNACYVIFTSGTTGRPKGTTVTHDNVTRLISATRQRLKIGHGDVWTLFHSLAFDFSVWEIWGALTTGGRVVVVPGPMIRDTEAFYRLVGDAGVTVLSQTPSAFRQFEAVDARVRAGLSLHVVVFGGEALDQAAVRRWASRHGYAGPRLINMYGITETTVHVTFRELDEEGTGRALTQLGSPLPGMRVHVLDQRGELCPVGVVGEIYIGGSGLTRGYTGHPDLTAARFVPDHLGHTPGGRLYRSGDLGHWNADGGLEYLGRSDTQVKVRGYRIELGDIQAALERSPDVQQAIALAAPGPQGDSELRVYAAVAGRQPDSASLRAYLESVLPRYMVPSVITVLDELPINTNGKVDTRSLLAMERTTESRRDVSPPRTPLEREIAAIWAETLAVDVVDLADNFFGAGGNSVLGMRMLFLLRDRLFVDITLATLVRTPNLKAFCAEVEKKFAELMEEVDLGSMIAEQAGEEADEPVLPPFLHEKS